MIKKLSNVAILVAIVTAVALATTGSGSAATGTMAPGTSADTALSGQSDLGMATTYNADGSSMTSDVSLDTAGSTASVLSDGYLCGNVGYNATVKWYMALTNWVSWTWRMHFGVHVCHNKVTGLTDLSASVISEMPTWSYCGVVARSWGYGVNQSSAHSYMEGCFQILDKILVQKFPWARITIGGNGNLWARSTGVYS